MFVDALEPQHHRFHFKCDSKSLRDRRIDFLGQRENVARGRAASIDERQGVTAAKLPPRPGCSLC